MTEKKAHIGDEKFQTEDIVNAIDHLLAQDSKLIVTDPTKYHMINMLLGLAHTFGIMMTRLKDLNERLIEVEKAIAPEVDKLFMEFSKPPPKDGKVN